MVLHARTIPSLLPSIQSSRRHKRRIPPVTGQVSALHMLFKLRELSLSQEQSDGLSSYG